MEKILEKFLRYVSIDTASDPESETQPSTQKQFHLLRMLMDELQIMGIQAELDENGYVMATIPSNINMKIPAIGFIAHVDTSPDAPGDHVKPQVIKNYDGKDIMINDDLGLAIRILDFPEIVQYKGQTLITTDGTSLLGADDKAGIAEIMSAAEYLMQHSDFKHGEIKIAFTTDEEIGRGISKFDVKKFGAVYAYTMDGGEIGELEFENFNAAEAKIYIKGRNIHPGYAKGKMVNSILIAMELNALLPEEQRPDNTMGYEGFFHLTDIRGSVEETTLHYIIRDHDLEKFEDKKRLIVDSVNLMNKKYGDIIHVDIQHQYNNMRQQIEPHYHIVEKAIRAMELADVRPKVQPIRGGTDGAHLSFMGIPCPNIFAGGHNFHGRLEFIPLESMKKATEVILNIIGQFADNNYFGKNL